MKKTRVKRIGVLQTSIISAIILFFFSLLIVIPMGFFMGIAGGFSEIPGLAIGGVAFMVFMPLLYAGMGFVTTAIWCLIYNLVAKWMGGIELQLEVIEDSE